MRVYGFPPLIHNRCTKLIVGTLPGVISLERNQYYGNSQNAFWRIVRDCFCGKQDRDYASLCRVLLKNKIALWDVFSTGQRKGSSDSRIRNPVMNNFIALVKQYPRIEAVLCNGRKAHKAAIQIPALKAKKIVYLPSTSPAYPKPYTWKRQIWKKWLRRRS
jgi:TDG/mug DNA glycosylase family protein